MPTYEYVCSKCAHRFDEIQPFSSEPVASCPKCGSRSKRQFTVPVVVYKGSGFYTTDHKGSSNSSAKNGSKQESGDSSSKSETKSESKPASEKSATSAAASGDN